MAQASATEMRRQVYAWQTFEKTQGLISWLWGLTLFQTTSQPMARHLRSECFGKVAIFCSALTVDLKWSGRIKIPSGRGTLGFGKCQIPKVLRIRTLTSCLLSKTRRWSESEA